MDRGRAAAALLALAACFVVSDAAPTTNQTSLDLYSGNTEGCYYNFQHYGEGDRIMTNEPCLNCTCHNRMLMCYLKVCPFTKAIGQDCTVEKRADQCCPIVTCPDVPVDLLTSTSTSSPSEYGGTGVGKVDNYGCSINGKYFPEGSKVPPTPNKPCEHCYCIRNMTTCVMQECTLHVDGCTPIYHKDVCCPIRYFCDHPEDEMPLLDDMTTTVRPTPGFLLTTTFVEEPTTTEVAMKKECVDHDQIYADGALIRSDKPCVHCYCMKGDIVCVVQECGAPMENEGKNCTSLPPREGHCCPDTYICEGDELSTERATDSIYGFTTLEPPRRVNIEGSGYRVESETTQVPETMFETEGSGDESTTQKSIDSEIFTTKLPAVGELDDKFAPEEVDIAHHPISTEASLLEVSHDVTTEPDKGLNTIEYETTEPSGFDKTTQKQDETGPSFIGKTTITSETKTTNLPYEESTQVSEIIVPSVTDKTTPIDEYITKPFEESSTKRIIDLDSTTSALGIDTKITSPGDQNIFGEGSEQEFEGSGQYETTTHDFGTMKPEKTSDASITTPIIDVARETTPHSIYGQETTTENLLLPEKPTEQNIEKLTTILPLESGQKDEIATPGTTDLPLEMSTQKIFEKTSTLIPELAYSTESEISGLTTKSLEKSTEKYLTTLLPEEKDITTLVPVTTTKYETSPFEESTQEEVEKLTTLLPESLSTISGDQSLSTLPEDFEVISTTLSKDKQDLPYTTTFNPVDNEIFEEIIPPGRIPGEGDCLQNGITYSNESSVPSIHKCQISCKCVSSIIKCDPIICMPQPENMGKCDKIYDSPDSCCPTYVCDHSKDTTPPESHSQMSGTETPVQLVTDCQGDNCEVHHAKLPTTTTMPVYEEPIQPVHCSDGKCSLPPVHDEEYITPTIQEIIPPSKDCMNGQCDLPPTDVQQPDCSDGGKCSYPPIDDGHHSTPTSQDIEPPRKDCSSGQCDLHPDEDHTTPAIPETLPPHKDCSDGKCDLPPIDVSPTDVDHHTTPSDQDIEPPRKDCSSGQCDLPSVKDQTTPAAPEILPTHEDCSDGKCDLPPIDVPTPDCSDGNCTPSPTDEEQHTRPSDQDIQPPSKDCSGGQCDLPPFEDQTTPGVPEILPPRKDCSAGQCDLPPIDDQTTPAIPETLPPHKDCSDGKCDLPPIDESPADIDHHTTPSDQDIEPPRKDCSAGQCDLPPVEDQTTPAVPETLPPHMDCSDGKCDLPPIDESPADIDHHTTPSDQDIEPPRKDCSAGQCDLPPVEDQTTPAVPETLPPHKDCSDGKCDLPPIDETPADIDHHTTPSDQDIEPPRKDCTAGQCDLPPVEDQTTPAVPETLPPHKDCSDGKCDLPPIDVSPSDVDHTTPSDQGTEPPRKDCSAGQCDLPPVEDQTTPAVPETLPPHKDCSDGKCDLPPIDESPADIDHHTTPSDQDIEPPRKDCSAGQCDLPPVEDQTTPAVPETLPPHKDCSDGKCDLPPIDVSPSDVDHTTPSDQGTEPPRKDCSAGQCDLPPVEDQTTPAVPETLPPHKDCSDGKCDLPPIDESPADIDHHTTPSDQDIEPPRKDCTAGQCDLPPVEDQTTPAVPETLPPHKDCSDGKCDLPPIDVSPSDVDHTTPSDQGTEPPRKDCSAGQCDLPPVEDQTTPAVPETLPPHKDCSDGKCDLPPIDVSPSDVDHTTPSDQDIEPPRKDCSSGQCDLPSVEDQTTPVIPETLPPHKDCSDGKCDLPPIDESPAEIEHHTTPSDQNTEPPRKDCSAGQCDLPPVDDQTTPAIPETSPPHMDCSDGKCDLPPIDVSPSDVEHTTPSEQDTEPPRKDCSAGQCDLPPVEDQTTPVIPETLPPHKDCSDGKCDLPPIDVSPSDVEHTTPSDQDTEPPRKDCSAGQCDLPTVEDQTTPAIPEILPPHKDCSDGKCDLPPKDVSPTDIELHTTPSDQDTEPPIKDCSAGQCDLPSVEDHTTPAAPALEDCTGDKCEMPTIQPDILSSITPTEIPKEPCEGDSCAAVNEICTDDNCRRTELSKDGKPPGCKGPECSSTEKSTVTHEIVEENIPVSTEAVDHDIHITTYYAEPETEKPLKSSDLPETDTETSTTNVFEEPLTQSIESITKHYQPEVNTDRDAETTVTTSKKDITLVEMTEPSTNVVELENLPKTTSAGETVTVALPVDQDESTESSQKTTYLPSYESDIHPSELSTHKDLYEIASTSIPQITTDEKPVESVTEEQLNTEIPEVLTTKILDVSQSTEKSSTDQEVYPTGTTHLFTSSPESIETESPLSQFTLQHDISTTPETSQDGAQTMEIISDVPITKDKTTEPSVLSSSKETATSSALDTTEQSEKMDTDQPDVSKVELLSTEAAPEPDYDKTTEHSIAFSETTPYLVELEEHPHKTDEVSSPIPEEQTTYYSDLEDKEPQVTESSSDKIPPTEMSTKKPHDESTVPNIPIATESVPNETEAYDLDNRIESNTSPSPTQTFNEQDVTTQSTVKPTHGEEITENVPFTSQSTFSTTPNKFENELTTLSPILDNKFGDEKPSVTTSASPTDIPKPFDESLPTDDSLPTEEGQFPPSGGYGQEPDYSDEDQAFGPGTCRYGGKVYVSAQQIPRDDPCDFCFCFRSDIICLQQSCPPPIHGCHEEPIQGFCCPRYECPVSMATALNLTTTTTTTTTTLPPHFLPHAYKGAAQRKGCQIKGQTYKVGEVVRASSGPCLHCTCGGDGQMKCDPKVCTPEPMLRQMIAAAVSAKRRR